MSVNVSRLTYHPCHLIITLNEYVGRTTDDAASRVKYVLCLYHTDPLQRMMQVSKDHDFDIDEDATMTTTTKLSEEELD